MRGGGCGSSNRIEDLHPEFQPYARELVRLARLMGFNPIVTSTHRTRSQQACLFRRYTSGQSRFPAAPPGQSHHETGLAFDLVPAHSPDAIARDIVLRSLGELWESWGGRWGGRFRDPIHFDALTSTRPRRQTNRPRRRR